MQIARHIIVIVTVKGTVIASTVCFSPERVVPIASLRKKQPINEEIAKLCAMVQLTRVSTGSFVMISDFVY